MNQKIITYVYLALLGLSGYALFAIKSEVQNLHFQIHSYDKQIDIDKKNISILKAEFSYLTSPKRLHQLVAKHLQLNSINAGQTIADPLLGQEEVVQVARITDHIHSDSQNIQWRYKHHSSNRSGIHKASYKRQ